MTDTHEDEGVFSLYHTDGTFCKTVNDGLKGCTHLYDANLQNLECSGSNLSGTTVNNCDVRGALFTGTNFANADLQGTNLVDANSLAAAVFDGADLRDTGLTPEMLTESHAYYDDSTRFDPREKESQADKSEEVCFHCGSPLPTKEAVVAKLSKFLTAAELQALGLQ